MKHTYLKTVSIEVNISPTSKSPTVKTSSVANVVTHATYGNDKEVCPDDSPFEVGIIMSINVSDLDGYSSVT